MSYLLLGLILRLDAISNTMIDLSVVVGLFFLILTIIYISSYNDRKKTFHNAIKPWTKLAAILFCIILFLSIIVPNTKQAAIIYCLPKIVNNEHIKNIPDKMLKLSDMWINKEIKEITKPTK